MSDELRESESQVHELAAEVREQSHVNSQLKQVRYYFYVITNTADEVEDIPPLSVPHHCCFCRPR